MIYIGYLVSLCSKSSINSLSSISKRLSVSFFFLLILSTAYAQKSPLAALVNLNMNQQSLGSVFTQLEHQTGYIFVYNSALIDTKRPVNAHFNQATLKHVLEQLLGSTLTGIKVQEKQIFLKTETTDLHTLKGKIIGMAGQPVYSALVKLVENGKQMISDGDGLFSFENLPHGTYHLQIRGLGYHTLEKEIAVTQEDTTFISLPLTSQEQVLGEVLVTEKTATQQLRESGFNVNAIDLSTYANTNSDINQILNVTTGVRIREEGGLGSNFNFSLNGFSGNQVKFFLDGLPMDNFGSSLTLNNFPVNMAERVEVYKGVLPINLGTDALGGAVNIVTRSNPNYLDVSYSIGSFNTHRASVNGAYTNAKSGFTVRTNAFFNYSDNNYKVLAPIKNLQTNSFDHDEWVKRFHDQYQSAAIQLEAGLTNKKYADKLLLGVIASENDKDLQTGVVMEEVYGAMKTKSYTVVPSLKYQKKNLFTEGLEANLYTAYNRSSLKRTDTTSRIYNWLGDWIPNPSYGTDEAGGERSRTQNKNTDREWLLTNNWNYRINAQQGIAFNYTMTDFHRKGHDIENPEALGNQFPSDLTKHVLGLSYNLDIWKKWTTSFFGKWYIMRATGYQKVDAFTDDERYEAVNFNYNNPGFGIASAMFVLPQWQVKASFERTYRLPESGEIFGDGVFTIPNFDLKPEKSNNFNVGLRYGSKQEKPHRISAEGNFIYRLTRDYIRLDQSVSGGNRSMENKGKVRTLGGEGEIKYDYKHRFFASVNATYQQILDKQEFNQSSGYTGGTTKNITYNYRLPNIPYLFANANVGTNWLVAGGSKGSMTFNYTLSFVEKYYLVYSELGQATYNEKYIIPRQFSHNVSWSYTLAGGKYNIGLECRNLANALIYDSYRLQKPGRSFSLKLRYFIHK